MDNIKAFKQLHQQKAPLILCNVWDTASANIAKKLGFSAIGTSSAAISSSIGYTDGEAMSFEELLFFVKRITATACLPLSVDIEAGYGKNAKAIANNIMLLAQMGVVGVNIEDSLVSNGNRQLVNAKDFSSLILQLKKILHCEGANVYINARTDPFLIGLKNAKQETTERLELYCAAGADGIFTPCVQKEEDIKALVTKSSIPVNVMAMPELPNFSTLQRLGVKRISMGNWLFEKFQTFHQEKLAQIIRQQSFLPIFSE